MSDCVARRALLMAITHRIFRQRSASHRRLVATCITSYALCQSPTGIRIFAPRISYPWNYLVIVVIVQCNKFISESVAHAEQWQTDTDTDRQRRTVATSHMISFIHSPRTLGPSNDFTLLNGWICLHGVLD